MSQNRFAALLLAFGTLAIYLPASHYGFTLYDDTVYISENSFVQNGLTWAGFKWAFTTWHGGNWHPLTWLSLMFDCQLFGLDAKASHMINILIHTANAILLFVLLLRWTKSVWPAAFIAALFAWHPLHVESVVWISERKDVLSAFFALLSLIFYTRFAEESNAKNPRSKIFYILTFLAFAAALMSKPMFVTLPFLMLLLDYWPLDRIAGYRLKVADSKTLQPSSFNLQLLTEKIPLFILVAASCAVTFLAQHAGGAVVSLKNVSLPFRFENTPVAFARYLSKIFWPEHLAIFYPFIKISPLLLAVALIVLILISAAAWMTRKSRPYFIIGWLWFLGMLVPVIGLVQVGGASMADRYSYFPSIGIFLIVALGIRDAAENFHLKKIMVAVPAILILAACLFLTHRQLNFWRNDIALFSHALAVTKNNYVAHIDLGYALEKAGRKNEALPEYREGLRIFPSNAEAHVNFANLLDETGHSDEALAEYETALRLNPKLTAAHNNLGVLYVEHRRFADAEKQYAQSMQFDSLDWHAPYLMGKALLKQGHDAEAIPYFRKAVRNAPDNPQVLIFVAQVLATDKNPKARDGKAALILAQKANNLTGGIQPAMLDALAMSYAELGNFDDARKAGQNALDLAIHFKMTNAVPLFKKRLNSYDANQPFRQSFTNTPAKPAEK